MLQKLTQDTDWDHVAFGSIWMLPHLIYFVEIVSLLTFNISSLIIAIFFDDGMVLGDWLSFIVLPIFLRAKVKASVCQQIMSVPTRIPRQPE